MKEDDFNKILKGRIEKIQNVLGMKAAEYARGEDRLHNFKRVAGVKGCTPADACIDGFCKHLVSILDMVDDIKFRNEDDSVYQIVHEKTIPLWEEKIGDAINYLILLEAIIKENITDENKSNTN